MFPKKFCMLLLLWLIGVPLAQATTIHGFVREKASKEPIIMGNVWIKGTTIGTTTNDKGYYVISGLQPGTYEIYFRYIGYKTEIRQQKISVNDDVEVNILLEEEMIELGDVVVTAERDKRELEIKPSQISMPAIKLRKMPQVAEPDLFRSLQMLPGVATLSDFSAGLYVRGGSPDQNLILLDHIDVYNPNHMFGFFSSFNTDAIKSVEMLKGGFPAIYGGRLSSVLNVINKEGNREEFHGVARVSLLSSTATLEGPWKHGSWMISGRRTYLELAGKIADFDLPYYFYDGHAKINYDINKNNQASLSFYIGNDVLDLSQDGTDIILDWGNKTFSAQWMHLFSSKLYSQFVLAGSRFDSDSKIKFDEIGFGTSNEIVDLATKGWMTYTPSTRHSLDFGFETKYLDFDLNYEVVDQEFLNSFTGTYLAAFVQDNLKLGLVDILQAGLRLDHYTDGGYTELNPRLSWKHIFTDKISTTASYGRFTQFINLVQQEGMSFADMWFPIDETVDAGKADHFILGFNYDNKSTFAVDLEAYYKKYDNLFEYRDFASRPPDEDLNDQTAAMNFYQGKGKAYGMDIYLRNNVRNFEGWLGYSLNWIKKTIDGYNYNREYYPTYDRRHTFTAIEDYKINQKWRLNLAFKYGSGQPYTEATARYLAMNPNGSTYSNVLEGEKNFYRLPDYHRLDLAVYYNTKLFGLPTEMYFQVVNVYNADNVWYRLYKTNENPATVEDYTMLPTVPTFGISVVF